MTFIRGNNQKADEVLRQRLILYSWNVSTHHSTTLLSLSITCVSYHLSSLSSLSTNSKKTWGSTVIFWPLVKRVHIHYALYLVLLPIITLYLFAGVTMKLMDEVAGIVAVRHCKTNVVTASVDAINFHRKIEKGKQDKRQERSNRHNNTRICSHNKNKYHSRTHMSYFTQDPYFWIWITSRQRSSHT